MFCPYHSDAEWRRLKLEEPEEFAKAVKFEDEFAKAKADALVGRPFLHRSCVPLDEVDLRTPEDRGQLRLFEKEGFGNECSSGVCGV